MVENHSSSLVFWIDFYSDKRIIFYLNVKGVENDKFRCPKGWPSQEKRLEINGLKYATV